MGLDKDTSLTPLFIKIVLKKVSSEHVPHRLVVHSLDGRHPQWQVRLLYRHKYRALLLAFRQKRGALTLAIDETERMVETGRSGNDVKKDFGGLFSYVMCCSPAHNMIFQVCTVGSRWLCWPFLFFLPSGLFLAHKLVPRSAKIIFLFQLQSFKHPFFLS